MRKKTKMYITLKSDLCVSSGYAYAGIIDTDVCTDQDGFPYIPAKRLKGVMREAAGLLSSQDTDAMMEAIFGVGGADYNNGIYLDDAVLCIPTASEDPAYDKDSGFAKMDILHERLQAIRHKDKNTVLTAQNILSLFSSIKAQTALNEKGVADANTLRYTRVVNQYLPECIDQAQGELTFCANIEYEENIEEQLAHIVMAVRHIGMDRNRGLGNVRCWLDTERSQKLVCSMPSEAAAGVVSSGNAPDKKVAIDYKLRNTAPLMLSAEKDDVTETYISGQAVLGALAGAYMRLNHLSEPDETFNDLFLSGKSIFSNLYITDSDGEVFNQAGYYPAPLYINRLKKSKKYVCVVKSYEEIELPEGSEIDKNDYNPDQGNQPKKLNGKYICMQENKLKVLEPKKNIIYHHSKSEVFDAGRMGTDGSKEVLYSMEVLEKGQLFEGSIIVEEKYAAIIRTLLENAQLRFGKSKSAQYGRCEVIGSAKENRDVKPSEHSLSKGDRVLIVFDTDAIIPGRYGYTTNYEEVQEYIAGQTGLQVITDSGEEPQTKNSTNCYMAVKTVTGYNAKMNLKRSSIPALKAGSAFKLVAPADGTYSDAYLGSYISEGFGKMHIVLERDLTYIQEEYSTSPDPDAKMCSILQAMYDDIHRRERFEEQKREYIRNGKETKLDISSALVGRITLMLSESRESGDPLTNFAERIASIKRTKERDKIIRQLEKWKICRIKTKENEKRVTVLDNVEQLAFCDEEDSLLRARWADYLAFILLHVKYTLSADKKNTSKS